MNRRTFIQSLAAAAMAPALPQMSEVKGVGHKIYPGMKFLSRRLNPEWFLDPYIHWHHPQRGDAASTNKPNTLPEQGFKEINRFAFSWINDVNCGIEIIPRYLD